MRLHHQQGLKIVYMWLIHNVGYCFQSLELGRPHSGMQTGSRRTTVVEVRVLVTQCTKTFNLMYAIILDIIGAFNYF